MANDLLFHLLTVFCYAGLASADNTTEYDTDPYLKYRPPFARSLPVQILITGVVLTIVGVLLIHLIFTFQYHWPLAPVNYVLQISGVTTLLISLVATLHVVLSETETESQKWPYMLSYIAVNVGDVSNGWTTAERATWLVMNATTSGLVQITHIQFMTLLYPSRLEGRLIFALLGPLAIIAAIMQLLPINGNQSAISSASAIRNVCNATLSLLFTASLFIWGFLVNRRQAWRMDGGTAAFGAAALMLALLSTALNFLYVPREEEYVWLPGLMWAVVLWQSFLGWWWWVGAGSGSGLALSVWEGKDAMQEMLKREEKREKRRKLREEKKKERKAKAKSAWKGVAGAFSRNGMGVASANQHVSDDATGGRRTASHSPPPASVPLSVSPSISSTSTSTTTGLSSVSSTSTLPVPLPGFLRHWYASLRRAHVVAARQQAVERVERIRELDRGMTGSAGIGRFAGWGFGSFWMRGRQIERDMINSRIPRPRPPRSPPQVETEDEDDDVYDARMNDDDIPYGMRAGVEPPSPRPLPAQPLPTERPQSMWWWGPLGRWRLKDSTEY